MAKVLVEELGKWLRKKITPPTEQVADRIVKSQPGEVKEFVKAGTGLDPNPTPVIKNLETQIFPSGADTTRAETYRRARAKLVEGLSAENRLKVEGNVDSVKSVDTYIKQLREDHADRKLFADPDNTISNVNDLLEIGKRNKSPLTNLTRQQFRDVSTLLKHFYGRRYQEKLSAVLEGSTTTKPYDLDDIEGTVITIQGKRGPKEIALSSLTKEQTDLLKYGLNNEDFLRYQSKTGVDLSSTYHHLYKTGNKDKAEELKNAIKELMPAAGARFRKDIIDGTELSTYSPYTTGVLDSLSYFNPTVVDEFINNIAKNKGNIKQAFEQSRLSNRILADDNLVNSISAVLKSDATTKENKREIKKLLYSQVVMTSPTMQSYLKSGKIPKANFGDYIDLAVDGKVSLPKDVLPLPNGIIEKLRLGEFEFNQLSAVAAVQVRSQMNKQMGQYARAISDYMIKKGNTKADKFIVNLPRVLARKANPIVQQFGADKQDYNFTNYLSYNALTNDFAFGSVGKTTWQNVVGYGGQEWKQMVTLKGKPVTIKVNGNRYPLVARNENEKINLDNLYREQLYNGSLFKNKTSPLEQFMVLKQLKAYDKNGKRIRDVGLSRLMGGESTVARIEWPIKHDLNKLDRYKDALKDNGWNGAAVNNRQRIDDQNSALLLGHLVYDRGWTILNTPGITKQNITLVRGKGLPLNSNMTDFAAVHGPLGSNQRSMSLSKIFNVRPSRDALEAYRSLAIKLNKLNISYNGEALSLPIYQGYNSQIADLLRETTPVFRGGFRALGNTFSSKPNLSGSPLGGSIESVTRKSKSGKTKSHEDEKRIQKTVNHFGTPVLIEDYPNTIFTLFGQHPQIVKLDKALDDMASKLNTGLFKLNLKSNGSIYLTDIGQAPAAKLSNIDAFEREYPFQYHTLIRLQDRLHDKNLGNYWNVADDTDINYNTFFSYLKPKGLRVIKDTGADIQLKDHNLKLEQVEFNHNGEYLTANVFKKIDKKLPVDINLDPYFINEDKSISIVNVPTHHSIHSVYMQGGMFSRQADNLFGDDFGENVNKVLKEMDRNWNEAKAEDVDTYLDTIEDLSERLNVSNDMIGHTISNLKEKRLSVNYNTIKDELSRVPQEARYNLEHFYEQVADHNTAAKEKGSGLKEFDIHKYNVEELNKAFESADGDINRAMEILQTDELPPSTGGDDAINYDKTQDLDPFNQETTKSVTDGDVPSGTVDLKELLDVF